MVGPAPGPLDPATGATPPTATGSPQVGVVFADALRNRPELAGLVTAAESDWPKRRWLMAEWAEVLGSDTGARHVLFRAGPGFGKTVTAAQFGLACAADGWTVAGVFFRHGYALLEDPLGVIEHLSAQLASLLPGFNDARDASRMESGAGNPVQVQITGGISVNVAHLADSKVVGAQVTTPSGRPVDRAWRCDIADPLAALHRTGALPRMLVVLDALDETSAATRLALADGLTMLPPPVRVLMTARPGTLLPIGDPATSALVAQLPANATATHTASAATGTNETAASPQQQDAALITGWASARLKAAALGHAWAQRMGERIAEAADRTFLIAAYLTDDLLRRMAAGETMPAADDVELPTGGLAGVYDAFLTRTFGVDTTKWRTLGRPVLGTLSVARGAGLTTAMVSVASELDLTDVSDTLDDCAGLLTSEPGSGAAVWRIWHRSFAEHLHASATYRVRPWDWQLRLGITLLPAALAATASGILDSDHRHRYATINALVHLVDAADDPDDLTSEPALAALAELVDAGGWVEALVLLAGPGPAALQLERLAQLGPAAVPWRAAAEAIHEQAHVLNAPATLTDGFTSGQLSLHAARSRNAELARAIERWPTVAPVLVARWSTAVSAGDVVMSQPGGITAMAATELGGEPLCLIGGSDGWVLAWSPRTGQTAGAWRVPDHRQVTCLACVDQSMSKGSAGGKDGDTGDADGRTALVAVGTETGTYALSWSSDARASVLWQAADGHVTAALALDMEADAGDESRRLMLVTSHREELRARDLVSGNPAGNPPSLPLPVTALAAITLPGEDGHPSRQGVLAGCFSQGGQSVIWDPRTDQTIGDLQFGGPVGCLAQANGPTPGPLAVGLLDTVMVGNLTVADGVAQFQPWAERSVGPTRKASPEFVTALTWADVGAESSLLAGDTAGRIHRLDPGSMARRGPWAAGHASLVTALLPLAGDNDRFLSSGSDGFVKSWQPADIDPAVWPDQVLTLEVVAAPDTTATVVCAHATGDLSRLRLDTGELVDRRGVHTSPVWALTWAGPAFGLVSGDSHGVVVCSQLGAPGSQNTESDWHSSELATLYGRISGLSAGELQGRTVVLASTLFSELVVLDQDGPCGEYPPFGGLPLMTRFATTAAGQCLIIEREVTADQHVITGEPVGRQLHLISPVPTTGTDQLHPIWHLWWDDPRMLGAWGGAWASSRTDGTPAGRSLLVVGLRDGSVLTFDLDRVVADSDLGVDQYQLHEAWPGRSPVATIAAGVVGDGFVTAWTTDDGWLFVEHSWQAPPLRMHLGSRVLVSRIAPDGTILLGGIDGVTAVRLRQGTSGP